LDKSPPYFFDDPRILFEEPCFFFDGGFDDVCLAGLGHGKKVGALGGSSSRKKQEEREFRNVHEVKMNTRLVAVNDQPCESHTGGHKHWIREDTLDDVKGTLASLGKSQEPTLPKVSLVQTQEKSHNIVSELKRVIASDRSVLTIKSIKVVRKQQDN